MELTRSIISFLVESDSVCKNNDALFLISTSSAVKVSEAVEKVETATAEEKKTTKRTIKNKL